MQVHRTSPTQAGSTHRLALEGELDMATTARARAEVMDVLEHGAVLELDLAGVTFMDSSGARFLLWAGRTAQVCDVRLVLVAASGPVQRLLALARAGDAVRGVCTWTLAS